MVINGNIKKVIEEQYPSAIKFNLEITGNEPLPRSSNIKQIRWAGSAHPNALFVEFFGYKDKEKTSGYIYQTNDWELWKALLNGVEADDISEDRTSTGRVFHQQVKLAKVPYEKVF
jgi:hypothetical protein